MESSDRLLANSLSSVLISALSVVGLEESARLFDSSVMIFRALGVELFGWMLGTNNKLLFKFKIQSLKLFA